MYNEHQQRIGSGNVSRQCYSRPSEMMQPQINLYEIQGQEMINAGQMSTKNHDLSLQMQQTPQINFSQQSVISPMNKSHKQHMQMPAMPISRNSICHSNNFNSQEPMMSNTMPPMIHTEMGMQIPNKMDGKIMFKTIEPHAISSPNSQGQAYQNVNTICQSCIHQNMQSANNPQYSLMSYQPEQNQQNMYYGPRPVQMPQYYHQYINQYGQLVQIYPFPQFTPQHSQQQQSNFQTSNNTYHKLNVESFPQSSNITENLSNNEPIYYDAVAPATQQTTMVKDRSAIEAIDKERATQSQLQTMNRGHEISIKNTQRSSIGSIEAKSINQNSIDKNSGIISLNSKKNSTFHSRTKTQKEYHLRQSSVKSQNSKNSRQSVSKTTRSNITSSNPGWSTSRLNGALYPGKNYMALHQQKMKKLQQKRIIPKKSTSPKSPQFHKILDCTGRRCMGDHSKGRNLSKSKSKKKSKSPKYLVKIRNNKDMDYRKQNLNSSYNHNNTTYLNNSYQIDNPNENTLPNFNETAQSNEQFKNFVHALTPDFSQQTGKHVQQFNPQNQELAYLNQNQIQMTQPQNANTGNFGSQKQSVTAEKSRQFSPLDQTLDLLPQSPPRPTMSPVNYQDFVPHQINAHQTKNNVGSFASFDNIMQQDHIESKGKIETAANTIAQASYGLSPDGPSRQMNVNQGGQISTQFSDPIQASQQNNVVINIDNLKDDLKHRQESQYSCGEMSIPQQSHGYSNQKYLPQMKDQITMFQGESIDTFLNQENHNSRKPHASSKMISEQKQFITDPCTFNPGHQISDLGQIMNESRLTQSNEFISRANESYNQSSAPQSRKRSLSQKKKSRQTSPNNFEQLCLLQNLQHEILSLKQTNISLIDQLNCLKSSQETQKMNILSSIDLKDQKIQLLQQKIQEMEYQIQREKELKLTSMDSLSGRSGRSERQKSCRSRERNQYRNKFQKNTSTNQNSTPSKSRNQNPDFSQTENQRQVAKFSYDQIQHTIDSDGIYGPISVTNEMNILDHEHNCKSDKSSIQYPQNNDNQYNQNSQRQHLSMIMEPHCIHQVVPVVPQYYVQNYGLGQPTNIVSQIHQVDPSKQEHPLSSKMNQSLMTYTHTTNQTKQFTQGILTKSPPSSRSNRKSTKKVLIKDDILVSTQSNQRNSNDNQIKDQSNNLNLVSHKSQGSRCSSKKSIKSRDSSKRRRVDLKQFNNISNIIPKKKKQNFARFQPSKLALNNYTQKTETEFSPNNSFMDKNSASRSVSRGRDKSNHSAKSSKPVDIHHVRETSQQRHVNRIRAAARKTTDEKQRASFADIVRQNNHKPPQKSPVTNRIQNSARVSDHSKVSRSLLDNQNNKSAEIIISASSKKSLDGIIKRTNDRQPVTQKSAVSITRDGSEDRKYQSIIQKSAKISQQQSVVSQKKQENNNSKNQKQIPRSQVQTNERLNSLGASPSPYKHSPIPMGQNPHPNSGALLWRETSPKPIVYKTLREQGSLSSKKKPSLNTSLQCRMINEKTKDNKNRQMTPKEPLKSIMKSDNNKSSIPDKDFKNDPTIMDKNKIKFNPLSLKKVNIVSNESIDSKKSNLFQNPNMSAIETKVDQSKSSFKGSFQNQSKRSINDGFSSTKKNNMYKQFINCENQKPFDYKIHCEEKEGVNDNNERGNDVLSPKNMNGIQNVTNFQGKDTKLVLNESIISTSNFTKNQPTKQISAPISALQRHKENMVKTNNEIGQIRNSSTLKNLENIKSIKNSMANRQRSKSSGRSVGGTSVGASFKNNENKSVSPHGERRKMYLESWQNQINLKVQQKEEKRMNLLLTKKLQQEKNPGQYRIR